MSTESPQAFEGMPLPTTSTNTSAPICPCPSRQAGRGSVGLWLCLGAGWLIAGSAFAELQLQLDDAPSGLESNILARTDLSEEPCDAPQWRIQRLYRRLDGDIEPALRAFGYYRADIDKQLRRDDDCWHVDLTIDPGERTRVRSRWVQVEGPASSDPQLQPVLAGLPLAEGQPLHHGEYEAIKTALREFAQEHGYLEFTFRTQQLRIHPEQAAAEIEIVADSGPRYRLGELRFNEQPLSDGFIRRLAQWHAGEPLNARLYSELDRRLSNTAYFKRVEVRRGEAEGIDVPAELTLEAAPRHAWRAGIGYATDTGPRLSLGYENRYLNRRGHTLDSELRLSPVESGAGVSYRIPGADPHQEYYSFGLKAAHEETDSTLSDSITLNAQQVLQWRGWTQTRFIELLHEQSEVGTDSTTATLLMPGLKMQRIEADDMLRTNHGYRVSFETRAAYEGLLSTTSLLQLRGEAKAIHRFGDAGRITGRLELGTTLGDSTGELPASLRFFAGGDNSVRGYDYKSLGPEDASGNPTGGRNLVTASLEYEHPIAGEDWWAGAFVDGGNAFDTDAIRLQVGYGVGLRWYSPVGRLRLDLAFPEDTTDDDWRIHFGLGADL